MLNKQVNALAVEVGRIVVDVTRISPSRSHKLLRLILSINQKSFKIESLETSVIRCVVKERWDDLGELIEHLVLNTDT